MGPATLPDGRHFHVRVLWNLKEGGSFLLRGGENAAGREEFVQERKLCAMGFGTFRTVADESCNRRDSRCRTLFMDSTPAPMTILRNYLLSMYC